MPLVVRAVSPGWPHRRRGGLILCLACGQDKQALALGEQRLGAALLAEAGHEDRDAFLAAKARLPAPRLLTHACCRWAAPLPHLGQAEAAPPWRGERQIYFC